MDSVKKPPFQSVAAELTRQIAPGESPLLSNAQMREANTKDGLNLVTWVGALHIDCCLVHLFASLPKQRPLQ